MCVERVLSSNVPVADGAPVNATPSPPKGRAFPKWPVLIVGAIVLDVLAYFLVPPYPKGEPGAPVAGIGDLISANLELPAPHIAFDFDPAHAADPAAIVAFHPSISSSILTTWIVMAVVLILAFLATRGMKLIPRGAQNAVEAIYEQLEDFAVSLGGAPARAHVPLFAAFFVFILFSNWSGLIPLFGKIEDLRAPTSDVNVTIGLAIVAFFYFQGQGIRRLGLRTYLGKFFVFTGFKKGVITGIIDLYVGIIEFFLEFVKPVTLAMRLWGNIFGGELAIGVITALTIAIVPIAMYSLEILLNFVQALIISVLVLMYTVIAIESHSEEEHAAPEFATEPEGNLAPPLAAMPHTTTH
jgi:F-type H+-transporting ATPase subunit a